MYGMNADTGKKISGIDQLVRSIKDIILTPIGSRVMEKDYGSYVFELLDQPGNSANVLKMTSAVVVSILRWEPRLLPMRVTVTGGDIASGQWNFNIDGVLTEAIDQLKPGSPINLRIPVGV